MASKKCRGNRCFPESELAQATEIRDEISQFVKQQPADQRIKAGADKVAEIARSLGEHAAVQFGSVEDKQREDEKFLNSMEKRLQEAAHVTGCWNELDC